MQRQVYLCKTPHHSHTSKTQRDKCIQVSKIKILNQKKQKKAEQKSTMNSRQQYDSDTDQFLIQDDRETFNYTFQGGITQQFNVNQFLLDINMIARKKSADHFLYMLRNNIMDTDYLDDTDRDRQWLPRQLNPFDHWRTKLIEFKQNPQNFTIIQQKKHTKDNDYVVRNRIRNRKTKQQLGKIFQSNWGLLTFYDIQELLKLLPTQIPTINLQYRQQQKEQFMRLQDIIISIYLDTKSQRGVPRSNQINLIRKSISNLICQTETLMQLLKYNIFNQRLEISYLYQQLKAQVQRRIVETWINLKDHCTQITHKSFLKDSDLMYFSEWMGKALLKHNYDYCIKNRILAVDKSQFELDTQDQIFASITLTKIAQQKLNQKQHVYIRCQSNKNGRFWDELAHQLSINFANKDRSVELQTICNSAAKTTSSFQLSPYMNYISPLESFRIYRLYRWQQKILANRIKGFYTRIYFINSNKIFYLSPEKSKSFQQKTYQLFSHIDPRCPQCQLTMRPEAYLGFINFKCFCGYKQKSRRVRDYKMFSNTRVSFKLQGIQKTFVYLSIKNCGKRNNFHQFTYKWIRLTKYSTQVPSKLKTKIPIFSKQTNIQIQYNRQQQNYLPLQICDSIIQNAGKGIRTKQFIKKGSLILTYVGVIKAHYQVRSDNQSIFSLGVIDTKDNIALLIDPVQEGNAAKYINTAYKKYVNCRTELGIFIPRDINVPEPAILIIATKDIMPNTELFYEYGYAYGNFINKKKQKK